MPSVFFALDLARRAFQVQQRAMEVTSHNVANANTPGFSRQVIELAASDPYMLPSLAHNPAAGQVGTGVEIASIRRQRDTFLDQQIRYEDADLGYWETVRSTFSQVEVVFNEPSDAGLSQLLGRFGNAWQDLANNPQDAAVRASAVEEGENLATAFNRLSQQITTVRRDVNAQVRLKVQEINSLATRIASLNVQITRVQGGGTEPSDLLDQRDLLLDQLHRLTGAVVSDARAGSLSIFVGSHPLVQAGEAIPIEVANDPNGLAALTWSDSGQPVNVNRGELKALLDLRDNVLVDISDNLDTLAGQFIASVNQIHSAAYSADNTTGLDYFAGTVAGDIEVNPVLKNDQSKVAYAAQQDTPGDGSRALAMAQLSQAQVMPNSETVYDFYNSIIARLGVDSRQSETMAENQSILVQHLQQRKESISGVSIDEELTNMLKYQRSFEAAARLVTMIDGVIQRIIESMGLVGR